MTRKCVVNWWVGVFVVDVFERSWPRLILWEWLLFRWLWRRVVVEGSFGGPVVVDERRRRRRGG